MMTANDSENRMKIRWEMCATLWTGVWRGTQGGTARVLFCLNHWKSMFRFRNAEHPNAAGNDYLCAAYSLFFLPPENRFVSAKSSQRLWTVMHDILVTAVVGASWNVHWIERHFIQRLLLVFVTFSTTLDVSYKWIRATANVLQRNTIECRQRRWNFIAIAE